MQYLHQILDKLHQMDRAEVVEHIQEAESPGEGIEVAVVTFSSMKPKDFLSLAVAAAQVSAEVEGTEYPFLEALVEAEASAE